MDFSEALKWLKGGGKATRNNWEPYGQFVTLKAALTEILPDGEIDVGLRRLLDGA